MSGWSSDRDTGTPGPTPGRRWDARTPGRELLGRRLVASGVTTRPRWRDYSGACTTADRGERS